MSHGGAGFLRGPKGAPTRIGCSRARAAAGHFAILALAACASGPPAGGDEPTLDNADAEELVETTIVVENRHWSDVTVYLYRRSSRARLGTVTSNSTQTFRVPIGMGGGKAVDLSLLADAIGSEEEFRTDPLVVLQGQEVLLRLEVRMVHSSVSIFWP